MFEKRERESGCGCGERTGEVMEKQVLGSFDDDDKGLTGRM